ncbi:MAG TPA: HlyD family efflux transporter periplasmic adaptor subunit [Planctomycetota bacterium]|nr:HlyD family efflux transporter periplasmic adaptor subunit [Planctomycetota bacterium]
MSISDPRRKLLGALAFVLATLGAAEDAPFVVPDGAQAIAFAFDGVVEIDRASATGIPVGARDLVLDWIVGEGERVAAGDALARFSTGLIQPQVPTRAIDREIAEGDMRTNELRRARELADLELERARLMGELTMVEARLARVASVDPVTVADRAAALRKVEESERQAGERLAEAQMLHDAGDLPSVKLAEARLAHESARLDVGPARLALERASAPDPQSIARLSAQVRRLRADLGVDAQGRALPGEGIGASIETMTAQHRSQREADALELDKTQRAAHDAERDAWDHTVIAWLEIVPVAPAQADAPKPEERSAKPEDRGAKPEARGPRPEGGGRRGGRGEGRGGRGGPEAAAPTASPDALMSIDVVAGGEPAAGFAAAAPWDEARGWGWVDEPPPVRATPGAGANAGAAIARSPAIWGARVADGRWRVRVGFGADRDWDGALARVATGGDAAPRTFFVSRRVAGGSFPVGEAELDVVGGTLEIRFGDVPGKRLRAPHDGIALRNAWHGPGFKTRWPAEQIVHVADPTKLMVRGRVHQDLAPLLRAADAPAPGATTGAPLTDLQARIATSAAEIATARGDRMPASIARVLDMPVALWRAPIPWEGPAKDLDQIAKEVDLMVAVGHAADLALGERVRVGVTLALPDGVAALPAHLVRIDGERAVVAAGGEERTVIAARVDAVYAVSGVAAGDRLAPPAPGDDAARRRGAWSGTVVAGARTPITLPRSWGRIRDLVPDGSDVTAGQVVVWLYNPSLDDQRANLEQEKRRAQQAFLVAGENRRAKALAAAITSRGKAEKERLARIDLVDAETPDPLMPARAEADRAKALLAVAAKIAVHAAAADPTAGDAARLTAAASEARRAELAARGRALDAVAGARSLDWLRLRAADQSWRAALADLALRDGAFRLAQVEARVGAALADLQLAKALEGNRRERDFNAVREMKAPVSGRLFYGHGWNEQSDTLQKFGKEFPVWGGQTVAEVLDMAHLAFSAEVPESEYARLRVGMAAVVEFPQLDRRLEATVSSVARALGAPQDRRDQGRDDVIARDTVVAVLVDLKPPPDLADQLVPGTKGLLVLPDDTAAREQP